MKVNYSYTRTSDLFGNFTGNDHAARRRDAGRLRAGSRLHGNAARRHAVQRGHVHPERREGDGRRQRLPTTNMPGLRDRLPRPRAEPGEAAVEPVDGARRRSRGTTLASTSSSAAGTYDTNGNPTPTVSEPLKDGGQFAPQSGGSGAGSIYINAKWQINANAMYQAPYGIEVSGNVFGRQGYPFPLFRQGTTAALGGDSTLQVLITPAIDYLPLRQPVEHRPACRAHVQGERGDVPRHPRRVQRVQREHRAGARTTTSRSPTFNALAQNLSPRIFRVGLVIGF